MATKILLLLAGTSLLAGCNLAPKYVRPVGAVPEHFPQGGAYPVGRADAPADMALVGWRDFFTDPRLVAVIETGLVNNRDLRVAMANVLQARAQYRVQRADLLPTITANGSATYTNSASAGTGTSASVTGVSSGGSDL